MRENHVIKFVILWVFMAIPTFCFAEGFTLKSDQAYPQTLSMLDYIYEDYTQAYDRVFDKEQLPYWWLVGVSTAALMAIDDKLISASRRLGRHWGVDNGDNTTTVARVGSLNILRVPTDIGSWMYFIGDGWMHAGIAAGFLTIGAWTDDDKTYSTGFQLVEGMITTTIATQTLKHVTGRETPNRATTPTGRWDFFPNQKDYASNVPKYDAFPSGHVAVSTMTLTVLAKNYPDNPWILPTGVTLISLLSYQMMNNGVHWASDYPVAIALGYVFGEIAYERGQKAVGQSAVQLIPIVGNDRMGMGMLYHF